MTERYDDDKDRKTIYLYNVNYHISKAAFD